MPMSHETLKALPQLPHLEHLKNQARALQRAARQADPAALSRVAASHPRFARLAPSSGSLSLGDAQLVVAREYGFASWSRLKAHVELARLTRPATVTLPVVRVGTPFLVPGVSLLFHFSDTERPAIETAVTNRSPLLCLDEREGVTDAPELCAVAWTTSPTSLHPDRGHSRLRVRAKAKLLALRQERDVLWGDAEPEPELSWPPTYETEAATRLHEVLERLSHRVAWLSRPELARLRADGEWGALLGAALKELEPAVVSRCATLSDPHETIDLVCRSLEARLREVRAPATPRRHEAVPNVHDASVVVLRSLAHPHLCGKRYDLLADVTRIGRAEACEIMLYSDAVSRVHASIERRASGYVVVDSGSTNGTFCEGDERRITHRPLRDGDRLVIGDAILCVLLGGDLDEKYRGLVDELTREDPLTRLENRSRFMARLERSVLAARGAASPLSVIALDVDGLQALNDRRGRLAGDRALTEVASALRQVSQGLALSRYAEGTFCVEVPGREREHALELARSLLEAVSSRRIVFGDESFGVTAAAGVASLEETLAAEELLDRALTALRQAKAEEGVRAVQAA